MGRGRDACWEHCVLVDATKQKVRCNYCQREFSGGVYRMKFHLAQIKNKDVVPCTGVPNHVRDLIQNIINAPRKQKHVKKRKTEQMINGIENSSSESGSLHPNAASSGRDCSPCPSLLCRRPIPVELPVVDDMERQKREEADKKIAMFFYQNSIPIRASKSISYQKMIDAISECGLNYKPPSYERLRTTLLEKLKCEINEMYKKLNDEWKETGCTILSDYWSNGSKSIVIFSVTCPKSTIFIKSIDVTSHVDDTHYLFDLLESVVCEIGLDKVVQVITDSVPSFVYAGKLLMSKYPSLFWSPCASYVIDKMLEDLSKLEWVSSVIEESKKITEYIYSHAGTLNMMKNFTGGRELIRPKITRSVTHFLSLRLILLQGDILKNIFSHSEWIQSRRSDAQAINSLLHLENFWKSLHEVVSVSEPLVKVLRVLEGDMPAIGYLHEGLERAKVLVKNFYEGLEEKYMPIWEIIDRRWHLQLYSPLHSAAALLNPSLFYSPNFKMDVKIRNDFNEVMLKMIIDDTERVEFTKEQPIYTHAHGTLGNEFAVLGRMLNTPGDWWEIYGYEVPTLQRMAIRILNQPCSSYWCKWNWSTIENTYMKKENKREESKLNDLVFVHCNLRLQSIAQNRVEKSKPVIFDEIDVDSEWPTESESFSLLLYDSWSEHITSELKHSSGLE